MTNTYKYQVCNGDSSQTNSTKCYERKACSYSCPSGYSIDTTSCSSGFTLKTTAATKVDSSCPAKDCGKCEKNFIPTPLPDPCTGSCSGDIPYYKVLQGNKCCCPTAGETNSRKCNCCIDIINPCPSNQYYVKSSDGSDCCCSDLNHTGGNWGSWEVPTSCYCFGPSVPQG